MMVFEGMYQGPQPQLAQGVRKTIGISNAGDGMHVGKAFGKLVHPQTLARG